jgi:hypothetical protein
MALPQSANQSTEHQQPPFVVRMGPPFVVPMEGPRSSVDHTEYMGSDRGYAWSPGEFPAEIVGVLWVRRLSVHEYLAGFVMVPGVISLVMFLLFSAMPTLAGRFNPAVWQHNALDP